MSSSEDNNEGDSFSSPNSRLLSSQCTQAQLESPTFAQWAIKMKENPNFKHRKLWEFCYIAQALHERGMLEPGRRGLGFAVGTEPLPALFTSLGCEIVASDLDIEEAQSKGWVDSSQHANSPDSLNERNICSPDQFREKLNFRFIDMRNLPDGLGTFDFIWSSCALEHLGTLRLGEKYIYESLKYLKPGGVAIHTTEYNVRSNLLTVARGASVIYRKRDLEKIAKKLRRQGYKIELDFTEGNMPLDKIVDKYPYTGEVHLKLRMYLFVATSFGLIIEN